MRPAALLLALVLPLVAQVAAGAALSWGVVTHVSDGDTVWVRRPGDGASVPVRIQGIDAPELCQAGGEQARAALVQQLLHQPVELHERGQDDYGRLLATVRWSGQDVGAWLVFNGLAWSAQWQRRAGPYEDLQALARLDRRGLWADARPEPPRSFRRRHGPCPHPAPG